MVKSAWGPEAWSWITLLLFALAPVLGILSTLAERDKEELERKLFKGDDKDKQG